jgi:hypothetical protein
LSEVIVSNVSNLRNAVVGGVVRIVYRSGYIRVGFQRAAFRNACRPGLAGPIELFYRVIGSSARERESARDGPFLDLFAFIDGFRCILRPHLSREMRTIATVNVPIFTYVHSRARKHVHSNCCDFSRFSLDTANKRMDRFFTLCLVSEAKNVFVYYV